MKVSRNPALVALLVLLTCCGCRQAPRKGPTRWTSRVPLIHGGLAHATIRVDDATTRLAILNKARSAEFLEAVRDGEALENPGAVKIDARLHANTRFVGLRALAANNGDAVEALRTAIDLLKRAHTADGRTVVQLIDEPKSSSP